MEELDIIDAAGTQILGRKARPDVHRDGDWHRCFHLWVVDRGGVLLQRRSTAKAAWPGYLDATAAGHLSAGESVLDGLREVREELGVDVDPAALVDLGVHRVDEPISGGGRNREHQHVFALRDDRPLAAWTDFDRDELDGLVRMAAADLARLLAGVPGPALSWDGERVTVGFVEPGELVPAPYLPEVVPRLAGLAQPKKTSAVS